MARLDFAAFLCCPVCASTFACPAPAAVLAPVCPYTEAHRAILAERRARTGGM
jgi:hypothetical protein